MRYLTNKRVIASESELNQTNPSLRARAKQSLHMQIGEILSCALPNNPRSCLSCAEIASYLAMTRGKRSVSQALLTNNVRNNTTPIPAWRARAKPFLHTQIG